MTAIESLEAAAYTVETDLPETDGTATWDSTTLFATPRGRGRGVRRMSVAREAIGHDPDLFVDANGAYGRKQAVRVLDRAADANVTWFEEPVSSDEPGGPADGA